MVVLRFMIFSFKVVVYPRNNLYIGKRRIAIITSHHIKSRIKSCNLLVLIFIKPCIYPPIVRIFQHNFPYTAKLLKLLYGHILPFPPRTVPILILPYRTWVTSPHIFNLSSVQSFAASRKNQITLCADMRRNHLLWLVSETLD